MAELPAGMTKLYRITYECPLTKLPIQFTCGFQTAVIKVGELMIAGCLAMCIEDEARAIVCDLDNAEEMTLQIHVPQHLAKFAGG